MLILLPGVELAAAMAPVNNVGCACQGVCETGWGALLEEHPQTAGAPPGRGNLNCTLPRRTRSRLRGIERGDKKQSRLRGIERGDKKQSVPVEG